MDAVVGKRRVASLLAAAVARSIMVRRGRLSHTLAGDYDERGRPKVCQPGREQRRAFPQYLECSLSLPPTLYPLMCLSSSLHSFRVKAAKVGTLHRLFMMSSFTTRVGVYSHRFRDCLPNLHKSI